MRYELYMCSGEASLNSFCSAPRPLHPPSPTPDFLLSPSMPDPSKSLPIHRTDLARDYEVHASCVVSVPVPHPPPSDTFLPCPKRTPTPPPPSHPLQFFLPFPPLLLFQMCAAYLYRVSPCTKDTKFSRALMKPAASSGRPYKRACAGGRKLFATGERKKGDTIKQKSPRKRTGRGVEGGGKEV